jgi:preprotein translocase subunit SecF
MIRSIRRRLVFLAVLTLLAVFFALPSLTKNLPATLQRLLSSDGILLGLDLQGGMNLILKVNLPQAVQNQLEQSVADLGAALRDKGIALGQVETIGSNHMRVQLPNPSDMPTLREILSREFPNLTLLSFSQKAGQDLGQTINQSINEVLSRTLVTSGTVLMVLIALQLMGGVLLRDFALALTIGVVVGTYSSVFVASPLVYIWPARRRPAVKAGLKAPKRSV